MTLTICYCTGRRDPRIEWFRDSLYLQMAEEWPQVESMLNLLAVDFYGRTWFGIRGVKPKPCVWQGEHRLTQENWFAMANVRNTGLCYAPDGWIAYVDDLSVLMPGWLRAVREAIEGNYICFGAYMKCDGIEVENGRTISYVMKDLDTRWHGTGGPDMISCGGDWLYGCSLVAPVEAFLEINGWPEHLCDGLGFEDVCTGICLGNTNKYAFRYNRNMLTMESHELHSKEKAFRKEDWHLEDGRPVPGGNGHDDNSHAALNIAKASKRFEQYFGNGFENIADLRQAVLKGGTFPIRCTPEHQWFTKIPLRQL